jgi:hypothetical protein
VTPDEELERSEVEAVLETRRELGLRYDAELVDGFADRIEAEVNRRVGAELQVRQRAQQSHASAGPRQLALGIVSMVAGIPITAINLAAADEPSLIGLTISWGGIAAVNAAHAWQSRRP